MTNAKLFGVSLLAVMIATPAFAQPAQPQANNPADAEAATNEADIIVTATKRAQTLQDTPISVAVATAADVERSQIRDLIDLQTLVPSLKVGQLQSSANTNFIIRGFGNGANNAGIEPSVGVFIDGVYRSRSAAQIGDLPAIERVEVLRGPQSTLFGKNASAGIISIVTSEPKFDFGGNLEASYGNYNAIVAKAYVTGPVSDTIAVSLAGNYNKRDGYTRYLNLNQRGNERNRYGVRGQILFQPSSDWKVRLIADYDRIDEVCCSVANVQDGVGGIAANGVGNVIRAVGGQFIPNQPFSYDSFANFASTNKIDNYGFSGQIDGRLSDTLAVTSITAYRGVKLVTNQDSDFTSADLIGDNRSDTQIKTFTQELRLTSDFDGPFNFLIGGYYFNEKVNQTSQILFGNQFRPYGNALVQGASGGALNVTLLENTFGALEGAPTRYQGAFFRAGDGMRERYRLANESFSLFGSVDFEITDGLTLTGGLNYTQDRKQVSTNVVSNDVFSNLNLDAPQFAPFRNQLLFQGGLAQQVGTVLGLGRSATAAEIGTFAGANPAAFGAISAGVQAFANANQNNPAANPLAGFRGFQFLPPFLNLPNAVESGRTSDSNLSYTLRLSYEFSRNISAYVTHATGFKASSVNLSRDSRPTPGDLVRVRTAGLATVNLTSGSRFAAPENAEVYEFGLKGSWQGFGFNFALFQQTLKGFQSNVFAGTGFVLGNAEKQSTRGFELDMNASPTRNLQFTASLTYLDPKFDLFTGGSAFNPATNTVGPANLTGLKPSGISNWSIAVGGTYTAELSDSLKAIFHVDYDHASSFIIAQGLPFRASPETLNGSITLALNNGLELSVWGRNLTAPKFNPVIFPGVAQQGILSGYPSPPAFYGASARFKF